MAILGANETPLWLTRIARPLFPANTFKEMEWLNRDICAPSSGPVTPVTPSTGQIWPRGNYDGNP